MKKILNALVCALLVVSMFFGAASTANAAVNNVNVEKEDVCDHDWWDEVEYTYEKYDKKYHIVHKKCQECDREYIYKEEHYVEEGDAPEDYEKVDNKYHRYKWGVCECGETQYVEEEHNWSFDYNYKSVNNTYHKKIYECSDCSAVKFSKNNYKHTKPEWSDDYRVIRYATLKSKAKLSYRCYDCGKKLYVYKPWKKGSFYSKKYYIKHNTVWNNDKKVVIRLKNPSKGAVIKLQVGKRKYTRKIKNNKKTVTIKIKRANYGEKISAGLYYKGKKVGPDWCDDEDRVWYSNRVRNGMTKKQVKYTWGSPESRSSSSSGYSYWFWGDGSYVGFKNGRVRLWYNAAS